MYLTCTVCLQEILLSFFRCCEYVNLSKTSDTGWPYIWKKPYVVRESRTIPFTLYNNSYWRICGGVLDRIRLKCFSIFCPSHLYKWWNNNIRNNLLQSRFRFLFIKLHNTDDKQHIKCNNDKTIAPGKNEMQLKLLSLHLLTQLLSYNNKINSNILLIGGWNHLFLNFFFFKNH